MNRHEVRSVVSPEEWSDQNKGEKARDLKNFVHFLKYSWDINGIFMGYSWDIHGWDIVGILMGYFCGILMVGIRCWDINIYSPMSKKKITLVL